MKDAAEGNRDFRISHRRNDAFGELFDAFNGLADTVQSEDGRAAAEPPLSLEATQDRRSPPDPRPRRIA